MVTELLALHEELVAPLRRERLKLLLNADYLARDIEQHEASATALRTRFGPEAEFVHLSPSSPLPIHP